MYSQRRALTVIHTQLMIDELAGVEAQGNANSDQGKAYCVEGNGACRLIWRIYKIRFLSWRGR